MKLNKKGLTLTDIKLDEDGGTFTAYGSKFGVLDQAREVTVKGCFLESIEKFKTLGIMPLFLWDHDSNEILGKWVSIEEDSVGLLLTGQFNIETEEGLLKYKQLKHGDLTSFSIGYMYEEDDTEFKSGILYLNKVDLLEVSLVPWACNEEAQVVEVKSPELPETLNTCTDVVEDTKPELFKKLDVYLFAKKLNRLLNK